MNSNFLTAGQKTKYLHSKDWLNLLFKLYSSLRSYFLLPNSFVIPWKLVSTFYNRECSPEFHLSLCNVRSPSPSSFSLTSRKPGNARTWEHGCRGVQVPTVLLLSLWTWATSRFSLTWRSPPESLGWKVAPASRNLEFLPWGSYTSSVSFMCPSNLSS